MTRITGSMTFDEFKNVCNNVNEDMSMREILLRYQNYLMFLKTSRDGRTNLEVGASDYYNYVNEE